MFDESDPRQHQMKILFGCGAKLGFCGSGEHTYLELMHIRKGVFEEGHPLAGRTYYGFGGFKHKTKKLTLSNCYMNNGDDDLLRVPVIPGNPLCLGSSIERMIAKFTPGQTRFYCKVMTPKQKKSYVADGGDPQHEFQPHVCLGKTKIKELFEDGAKILGLDKPEDFYPHSLRAMFITDLANDPNVSNKELLSSACHASISSSIAYQT